MTDIPANQAAEQDGVTTRHEIMPNGERRFRLMNTDGNGYILTRSPVGGWQKSHSHERVAETYVVEKGWMLFVAQGADGKPEVSRLGPGEAITSPVGRVHNVYLPAGSEIHTIKHGGRSGVSDWWPHPHFDSVTAKIPVGDTST